MSYAFSYFFSPVNGAFNQILTGLGLSGWICKWLSDPAIVNFVLAAVSAWRFSGYHIVLFSTGLTSIPTEMMEAAVSTAPMRGTSSGASSCPTSGWCSAS